MGDEVKLPPQAKFQLCNITFTGKQDVMCICVVHYFCSMLTLSNKEPLLPSILSVLQWIHCEMSYYQSETGEKRIIKLFHSELELLLKNVTKHSWNLIFFPILFASTFFILHFLMESGSRLLKNEIIFYSRQVKNTIQIN